MSYTQQQLIEKLEGFSVKVEDLKSLWDNKNGAGGRPFLLVMLSHKTGNPDKYFVCDHLGCKTRVVVRECSPQATLSCKEHKKYLVESMNIPMSTSLCWVIEGPGKYTAPTEAEEECDG